MSEGGADFDREEPQRDHQLDDASPGHPEAGEPGSPAARRRKEKKHKKEKHKHKHKSKDKHREKVKRREEGSDRGGGGGGSDAAADGERAASPGIAAEQNDAAEAAAGRPVAAVEPAAPAEAVAPRSPSAAGPAEPPAAAAPAASAEPEEGELPEEAAPPSPRPDADRREAQEHSGGGDGRDREPKRPRSRSRDRDRARDRSRSPDRDRGRGRYDRPSAGAAAERDRGLELSPGGGSSRRDRSPAGRRDRSPRRDWERPASAEERRREDDSRARDRPPSRPRSRSPDRGRRDDGERLDRERERELRDRARQLPPRPYDRERERGRGELDRRRGGGGDDWRRAEDWQRRGGGGGGAYDRRRSPDGRGGPGRRRSRSRSRSREQRKRDRSGSRERGGRGGERQREEEEDDEEFQKRVAAALEGAEEEDEDRLIEERRRRRQQILAKHREQQQLSESIAAPTATALHRNVSVNFQPAGGEGEGEGAAAAAAAAAAPSAPPSAAPSAQPSPARQPAGSAGTAPRSAGRSPGGAAAAAGAMPAPSPEPGLSEEEEEQPMGEGGVLDIWKHDEEEAAATGDTVPPGQAAAGTKTGIGEDDGELAKRVGIRRNVDVDMFAEEDDIFAATPPEAAGDAAAAGQAAAPAAAAVRKGLLDNYDDHEGYYNFQVGEQLADRYEVVVSLGKGVFSSVLKARDTSRRDPDTQQHPEVAIKVIRANETMFKAGQMEKVILRKLSEADREGRRHCIRMLSSFEYRNHLCLVFESLDLNLRELTKRYGRGIGLSINAVRIYAQQMLVALHHLKNCGVLHADIKPDNILVNDRRTVVKLCDFGSAMFTGDNEITPYLVSRFYRPPEVILGLPYDHPMDMWSVGCVIYELFTGHILFPGKTNNEMLKLMMDVKGPFPKKMLKKAEFGFKHFESDPNMSFALLEEDPVTKRPVRRLIPNPTVKHDFSSLLAGQSPDRRKLAQLCDLLERMMALDPDRRISPKDALRHPFIKEPPPPASGGGGGTRK